MDGLSQFDRLILAGARIQPTEVPPLRADELLLFAKGVARRAGVDPERVEKASEPVLARMNRLLERAKTPVA